MDSILIAGILDILTPEGFFNLSKVILGLWFVIFVHELGHFLAAKACGVKCEKFYVGFDPPMKYLPSALCKFQWGETEYGIGVIPLGGYVKMLGQDDNPGNAEEEAERAKVKKVDEEGNVSYEHDPRSYQAKTVPQRMLIISAGVIMNLIFAVLMAMVAYRMGVSYGPCEIQSTQAGKPAWVENIPPGSKIVGIGKDAHINEYVRFKWDLLQAVGKHGLIGEKGPMYFKIRTPDGELKDLELVPSERLKSINRGVSIGIAAITQTNLSKNADTGKAAIEDSPAASAEPPLEPGDVIVAINGKRLPVDEETKTPLTFHLLNELAQHRSEDIQITVVRQNEDKTDSSELDVKVGPSYAYRFGLIMKMGPIVAVQKGSPAAAAGLKEGDVITKLNGQPVGDPFTLADRIAAIESDEVELTIIRGEDSDSSSSVVKLTKNKKRTYIPLYSFDYQAIDTLGVAFDITTDVVDVIEGSGAAKAGLKAGDQLTKFKMVPVSDEVVKEFKAAFQKRYDEVVKQREFDSIFNWTYVFNMLQANSKRVEFEFEYRRGDEVKEVTLAGAVDKNHFLVNRGFNRTLVERIHVADSWGEAFNLGVRETKERMLDVVNILGMLFTGKIGVGSLSGPIGIVAIANAEASYGFARLLIFLTLLSANLAILNSLPIPVLDGGHFLFLTIEGISRRPVSEKWQSYASLIGLFFLLGLIIFVSAKDILRLT